MRQVTLNCKMPFCYRGNFTWYDKGQKLFLFEQKEMYFDDECQIGWKVGYTENIPFDGHCRADAFDEWYDPSWEGAE